jgi:3-hydroxyacyl-CoA dehydrogenase/enoyl-CoA hydratase/3-hydroxybutyryl-CoA epimerase
MPETAVYVLEKMAHGYKRLGRAYGAGFYDYPESGRKSLWPGLSVFQRGARKAIPTVEDIRERLLYAQAIETLRCLDEGVLESVRDANIGSILGWGFPAWAGGTVQYVNHIGVQRFVERARVLASLHGERFTPPDSLIARATRGEAL